MQSGKASIFAQTTLVNRNTWAQSSSTSAKLATQRHYYNSKIEKNILENTLFSMLYIFSLPLTRAPAIKIIIKFKHAKL